MIGEGLLNKVLVGSISYGDLKLYCLDQEHKIQAYMSSKMLTLGCLQNVFYTSLYIAKLKYMLKKFLKLC